MPCEFVALMGAFAPLFSKPVFQHVHVLLVGAILSPGKRTVTQAGPSGLVSLRLRYYLAC